jgi:hypothetical protein
LLKLFSGSFPTIFWCGPVVSFPPPDTSTEAENVLACFAGADAQSYDAERGWARLRRGEKAGGTAAAKRPTCFDEYSARTHTLFMVMGIRGYKQRLLLRPVACSKKLDAPAQAYEPSLVLSSLA